MLFKKIDVTGLVVAMGDSHDPNILSILDNFNLTNFCAIHVGDFGCGFYHPTKFKDIMQKLQDHLDLVNGKVLIIRGNHDDPEYFTQKHFSNQFDNIEFVEDYSYKTINGKKFLFVGGATSIDRQARTTYRDYWPREKFVLPDNYETLETCDVLITHSSGINEFPVDGLSKIAGWFKNDPTLKDELIEERELIQKLYNQVKPSIAHLWGHFHEANTQFIDGVKQQCLDINEVVGINI